VHLVTLVGADGHFEGLQPVVLLFKRLHDGLVALKTQLRFHVALQVSTQVIWLFIFFNQNISNFDC